MLEAVGFLAGTLTALAFVPQVLRTWKTRSAGDLSWGMLSAQTIGVALWIGYGVGRSSLPVIASNSCTLVLMIVLIALKKAS